MNLRDSSENAYIATQHRTRLSRGVTRHGMMLRGHIVIPYTGGHPPLLDPLRPAMPPNKRGEEPRVIERLSRERGGNEPRKHTERVIIGLPL
jgi:hypothetical protein